MPLNFASSGGTAAGSHYANLLRRMTSRPPLADPNVDQQQHVFLPSTNDSNNDKSGSRAYVQSLNYLVPSNSNGAAANQQQGRQAGAHGGGGDDDDEPFAGTDEKSVVARLTTLLLSGYPVPYSLIRAQFPPDGVPDDTLLKALSVCAVLVRGNFCLHSKFLAVPKSLQKARTFVLLLLQMDEAGGTGGNTIERAKLDRVFRGQVSSVKLLALLRQVAKQQRQQVRPGQIGSDDSSDFRHHWTLKVEDDLKNFKTRFPKHTSMHETYWKRQAARFEKELLLYNARPV